MSKILTKHFIGDYDVSFLSSDKISAPFTQVSNRALIADPSKSLTPLMGIDRIMTHELAELLSEQGPSGARVFKIPNDEKNLIRLVGNWKLNPSTLAYGNFVETTGDTTSFAEVTFYGTGLNMMVPAGNAASDNRVTVDGGVESADVLPTISTILDSRNYAPNIIIPLVSGLVPGVHTVKIRNASASGWLQLHGIEIINSSSQVRVGSGSLVKDQRKVSQESAELFDYKPSSLGSRGGRVVIYSSGGQLQRAVQAVNPSQQNLTSADHTNEEIIDTIHFREFGTSRTDDFTTLEGSANKAFTLDDGTTTLVNGGTGNGGNTVRADNTDIYRPGGGGDGSFGTLTFVGTGLDIVRKEEDANGSNNTSVFVDGVSIGTLSSTNSPIERIEKVVSGLPYGTHTVRIVRNSTVTTNLGLTRFIIYGPKKPLVPENAVEIADYNVMADFVANTTTGLDRISQGTLRKHVATREMIYVNGTSGYSLTIDAAVKIGGWAFNSSGSETGQEHSYTFFGTGFDYRFTGTTTNTNFQVFLNGVLATTANFPTLLTSSTDADVSHNTATGIMDCIATSTKPNLGIALYNLPLARYTVRFVQNGAAGHTRNEALDIITPIHTSKNNSPLARQHALNVGSQGLLDVRPISIQKNKTPNWTLTTGVSSAPSTTSTSFVLLPDMKSIFLSEGGLVEITFDGAFDPSSGGIRIILAINGVQIPVTERRQASTSTDRMLSLHYLTYLGPGAHNISIYWRVDSGTGITESTNRILTVKEL